jgi:hypothetical protein
MSAPISTTSAFLALAIATTTLGSAGASACGLWFLCDRELRGSDYPPMYVPAYDPRVGPRWTNNGWSYPSRPHYYEPMPGWSRPPRGYGRGYDERFEPDRAPGLK